MASAMIAFELEALVQSPAYALLGMALRNLRKLEAGERKYNWPSSWCCVTDCYGRGRTLTIIMAGLRQVHR